MSNENQIALAILELKDTRDRIRRDWTCGAQACVLKHLADVQDAPHWSVPWQENTLAYRALLEAIPAGWEAPADFRDGYCKVAEYNDNVTKDEMDILCSDAIRNLAKQLLEPVLS